MAGSMVGRHLMPKHLAADPWGLTQVVRHEEGNVGPHDGLGDSKEP